MPQAPTAKAWWSLGYIAVFSTFVPVVLYSILPHARLAELARAAGADAFVHKGDGVAALVSRMDELLSDEILF